MIAISQSTFVMERKTMIVTCNCIPVNPEYAAAFEERFADRASLVDGMPGFVSFQLLRPKEADGLRGLPMRQNPILLTINDRGQNAAPRSPRPRQFLN